MPNAMVALANLTLGSAQSTVTFGSIPTSGYRDLRLVVDYISTNNSVQGNIRINSDTASNYTRVIMAGWPTTSASSTALSGTSIVCMGYSAPDNTVRVSLTVDFLDSNATDKHKSLILRSGHSNEVDAVIARWASTSAITTIQLFPDSGTFAAGSTFSLYGIVSA